MLRPLLEQAADPLHQTGGRASSLFGAGFGGSGGAPASTSAATTRTASSQEQKKVTPKTMSLFKQKVTFTLIYTCLSPLVVC